MDAEQRAALEQEVRGHHDRGDWHMAATAGIKGYGPEILGYLTAMSRAESDAAEAFSVFCEDLWKGLPRFRWQSSFRTWAYTLARHALFRLARDPARKPGRNIDLEKSPEIYELAEAVRSTTLIHLRTETKSKVAELRERLDPDDRTLLILRVDRQMPWNDIAVVMAEGREPTEPEIKRVSAALRKRFERVKERLRKLAEEQDLLPRS